MNKVIFVITALLSFNIYAFNFSGVWTGKGEGQTPKRSFKCDDVEMRVHIQDDKMILRGGHYNCTGLSAEYPYSTFKINNGNLIQKDKIVGSIDAQTILLKSPADGFELTLNLYKGKLYFTESWIEGENYLIIGAELTKN
jgi:hypothetical protein